MKTVKTTLHAAVAAAAVVLSAGFAQAHDMSGPLSPGYVIDSQKHYISSTYTPCVRTGYWTPAMAVAACDPDLVKKAEAPKPAPAADKSATGMVPPAEAAGPEKPAFEKVTLQAETLFDFDKATVRADGKKVLDDEVVSKMKQFPQVEVVLVTGHADRIGKDSYNQKLSQKRADAVKDYLVTQGVEASRIETASKGESEPVVACDDIKGAENRRNKKLIECLQPNRRVVVEVKVQRPTN